jgi:hypothetical protein
LINRENILVLYLDYAAIEIVTSRLNTKETKETGFLPKSPTAIKYSQKNPVSRPTENLRNQVLAQITDCNQIFSKKPGFSPHRKSQKPGFSQYLRL